MLCSRISVKNTAWYRLGLKILAFNRVVIGWTDWERRKGGWTSKLIPWLIVLVVWGIGLACEKGACENEHLSHKPTTLGSTPTAVHLINFSLRHSSWKTHQIRTLNIVKKYPYFFWSNKRASNPPINILKQQEKVKYWMNVQHHFDVLTFRFRFSVFVVTGTYIIFLAMNPGQC